MFPEAPSWVRAADLPIMFVVWVVATMGIVS
jgi:hypothetical protein